MIRKHAKSNKKWTLSSGEMYDIPKHMQHKHIGDYTNKLTLIDPQLLWRMTRWGKRGRWSNGWVNSMTVKCWRTRKYRRLVKWERRRHPAVSWKSPWDRKRHYTERGEIVLWSWVGKGTEVLVTYWAISIKDAEPL